MKQEKIFLYTFLLNAPHPDSLFACNPDPNNSTYPITGAGGNDSTHCQSYSDRRTRSNGCLH